MYSCLQSVHQKLDGHHLFWPPREVVYARDRLSIYPQAHDNCKTHFFLAFLRFHVSESSSDSKLNLVKVGELRGGC